MTAPESRVTALKTAVSSGFWEADEGTRPSTFCIAMTGGEPIGADRGRHLEIGDYEDGRGGRILDPFGHEWMISRRLP